MFLFRKSTMIFLSCSYDTGSGLVTKHSCRLRAACELGADATSGRLGALGRHARHGLGVAEFLDTYSGVMPEFVTNELYDLQVSLFYVT